MRRMGQNLGVWWSGELYSSQPFYLGSPYHCIRYRHQPGNIHCQFIALKGTTMLTDTERIRLSNFKRLHGMQAVLFEPRISHLLPEVGCSDRRGSVQDGTAQIDAATAEAIEATFGLTAGWLSVEHLLDAVETVRLDNFHMLHGTKMHGYHPKIDELCARCTSDHGTAHEGDTQIDAETAGLVETAYGLPFGWLSIDHRTEQ